MRPRRLGLFLSLAAASLSCTRTNITAPKANAGAGVILFSSNRQTASYQIYRIGADGHGLVQLTDDGHNNLAPVLSHDGQHIAWQREVATASGGKAQEIWVMNADGSNPQPVVQNGAFNQVPSWTAGDAALVYASDVTGDWEIFKVARNGGTPVDLTNDPFADQYPRVTADGTRIVFQSNRNLNFEIYTMALDGSGLRNVTNSPGDNRFPSWSPDGQHIVWCRYLDNFQVWEMNADGSGAHALYPSPFSELNPSVSPDGQSVVFVSDRSPPASLYILPMTGGAPQPLTGGPDAKPGSDVTPSWTKAP